jgi:hypothetical protein
MTVIKGNINDFTGDLAKEIKVLRDRIELGIANEVEYKRYHELINLAGIEDTYIQGKLHPFRLKSIEDYYSRQGKEKDDSKILGIILGLGLAALFLWSLSENKKR